MSEEMKDQTTEQPKDNLSSGSESPTYNNIIGLLVFMAFLTIPYIYNSHLTDRKFRKSEKIKTELDELRSEFITLKSELVGENKQSDIARKLDGRDIEQLTESPINLDETK